MCKNKFIDIKRIKFNNTPKLIKKEDSKCFLKDVKVQCLEKHPNKSLCLFHNSIFAIWNVCGGYKILEDTSITDKEKFEIFLKDLKNMDFLDHNSKFTEEVIDMIESYFEMKFNKGLV